VPLYRDQGVVLRTIKLGETDRIVTLLSEGHGKVRAVAKGIRRPGSRFGARLEPTVHVAFQCYEGRNLDVVTQVETIEANRSLREHYASLTHAISMLEAVDQTAPEREPAPAVYRLLVGALRTLATTPSPVVSTAFFWKLLSLEGLHPAIDECVRCGSEEGLAAFDTSQGGVICADCAHFGGREVHAETLEVLRRILGGDVRGVLAAPPEPRVLGEVERFALDAIENHLERRLRSTALLARADV
jgi:DNA repair protein RecO (recombination protein O)